MRWQALAVVTIATLLGACSFLPPAIDQAHAPDPQTFRFFDGAQALYYRLDKRLSPALPDDTTQVDDSIEHGEVMDVDTFVFFISGSGCTSLRYFLPHYFRGLEGESGPMRIFMLQKRFIGESTWGRSFGCDPAFIQADHPSQWLADQAAFITAQRDAVAVHRRPSRIVIVGVSEGAEIAPLLARSMPGITHVVLLGNGGMPPLQAYRLQLLRHGMPMPAELAALSGADVEHAPAGLAKPMMLAAGMAKTAAACTVQPDASRTIAGHSWRYWCELAQLDPTSDLLALTDDVPIWVAMGAEDDAVPIASAQYLAREFARHRRPNLVLRIYPGADHQLVTNSRANTTDFWFAFDRSMAESPLLAIPTLP